MRRSSRAGRACLSLIAAGWGCRGSEPRAVEPFAVPISTAPRASASASDAPSVSDAGVDSHLLCPRSVGGSDSSSGLMLEVDGPVWGVRELWLSSDGDFR